MIEGYLFGSALRDYLRPRRVAVWLVVAIALFGIGLTYRRVNADEGSVDSYVLLSAALVYRILALAAAIFSTAVVAQEVEGRTIVYLLTRPVPRWKLLVFRTLAAMVTVFLVTLFSAVAVAAATVGVKSGLLPRDLMALAMGAAGYTALFVLVSLLLNRSMIFSLLFAFGWETFVGDVPGDLHWFSVNSYLSSIAQKPAPSGDQGLLDILGGLLGTNTIPAHTAWGVMILLVLGSLGLGAFWFTTHEYVPREDAE